MARLVAVLVALMGFAAAAASGKHPAAGKMRRMTSNATSGATPAPTTGVASGASSSGVTSSTSGTSSGTSGASGTSSSAVTSSTSGTSSDTSGSSSGGSGSAAAVPANHSVKFTGTINIKAPGVFKKQIQTASKKTLAIHFAVPEAGVEVNATESRRLRAGEEGRRLAGNWAIEYEFMAKQSQVDAIGAKAKIMSQNTTAFASTMKAQLISAGVSQATANAIEITGVSIQKIGAGGNAECFYDCASVNTTTVMPIGETSGSPMKPATSGIVASVLAVLCSISLLGASF